MKQFVIFLFITIMMTDSAKAEWHEVNSDHFRVIADQNEKQVRAFALRLEHYHAALNEGFGVKNKEISPSNRVTVYVVRNQSQIRKLYGGKNRYVAGFYIPRAASTVAFVPRVKTTGKDSQGSERILFHEYAHHFLLSSSSQTLPRWVSEGFAEFYSFARFESDGGVGLGLPAYDRLRELIQSKNVPLEALLDREKYRTWKGRSKAYDNFYGRSWLLYHYLTLSGEREGQLTKFLNALKSGSTESEAAAQVFGDLTVLNRELNLYMKRKKLRYAKLDAEILKVGKLSIRKLSKAESEAMPLIIQQKRGVNREDAIELLADARILAARYPNDSTVLSMLSEAEYDAGNSDKSIIAADKALAIDPKKSNAIVQKIYAQYRIASNTSDDQTEKVAWKNLVTSISKLNRLENDHPIPLIYYYLSLQGRGKEINENAAHGIERALQLAPYDKYVRMLVIHQLIEEKKFKIARGILLPLVNDPHRKSEDGPAQELLDLVDSKIATQSTPSESDSSNSTAS